jgi:hypothetical protein
MVLPSLAGLSDKTGSGSTQTRGVIPPLNTAE